jgi:ribosomal protein S18 acetylase RimI-like enzyme
MNYSTEILNLNDIEKIKPLWEKLNERHFSVSKNFKRHYKEQTFEKRCEKFRAVPEGCLRIEAARDAGGVMMGYCICSIENGAGELDSIYALPECRGARLGSYLAQRGIEWMKQNGCTIISVTVADGNEDVFPFYESLGFAVRKTVLQLQ